MARATADIGKVHYKVSIDASGHRLVADEPKSNGGANVGPAPYDLLLASLGACTAITLRMYADRKGWPLTSLSVELLYVRADKDERITRRLHLRGDLSEEQRARFADIAERTPVTLTLKKGLPISTELVPVEATAELDSRLDEALEESFPASDPPAVTPE
jgi:putative redox protein